MKIPILPLEIRVSEMANAGFFMLLVVPVLLVIALVLGVAKRPKASKKVLILAGIVAFVGGGLCTFG